ncbi:MAG: hypothetical protein E3J30_01550 [Anaerolineales bacterium]|nr:MAG: hypothetical protein E3J30_01550 [Anaerolineales bacterium]
MKDPLDELINFAERTYVRLEAETLIMDCIERGEPKPFFKLLEELILAGTSSLSVLREILDVIRVIKAGLGKEGLDVRQDLVDAMAEFGIALPKLLSSEDPEAFRQICGYEMRYKVNEIAYHLEIEESALLEEICIEAGNKVTAIAGRMAILTQLEENVQDWIDGLAYDAVHKFDYSGWNHDQSISH